MLIADYKEQRLVCVELVYPYLSSACLAKASMPELSLDKGLLLPTKQNASKNTFDLSQVMFLMLLLFQKRFQSLKVLANAENWCLDSRQSFEKLRVGLTNSTFKQELPMTPF